MRLDQWLFQKGLVKSRTQARDLVQRGDVKLYDPQSSKWFRASKASYQVSENLQVDHIQIQSDLLLYASRAGLKLHHALVQTQLDVKEKTCLDVGQSTGGFTDCLLSKGAEQVLGVEVGHSQLVEELRQNDKVLVFENLDIRQARKQKDFSQYLPVDLAVIDVSFISLCLVLPNVLSCIKPGGFILALVKPQFELGPKDLDKRGIVRSLDCLQLVKDKICDYVKHDLKDQAKLLDYFPSQEKGKDGNEEFFIFIQKNT